MPKNDSGENQSSPAPNGDGSDSNQKLDEDIKNLEQKAEEYLDGWKRAKADFINYKKEQEQTMSEFVKFANSSLILQILPVLDNFNLAIKHLPEGFKENEWIKGIFHIKTQLEDILKNQGIEEIKSEGEKFNPEIHEIVGGESEGDMIVEEIQKGYRLHGKVIRAARVKVEK